MGLLGELLIGYHELAEKILSNKTKIISMKTKSIPLTMSVLLFVNFYLIDTNEIFSVISYSDKLSF